MDMLGTILADEFEQMAIAMRATALQADGRANGVASAPIIGEEDRTSERSPTAGGGNQPIWNFGEKGAGRNQRQFTGWDVKQIESPGLRLICNPNQVVRSMSGMPMRQTTQKPTRIAPRGVVSLMVIEGGKR